MNALAKHMSYSDLGRAQNAGSTKSAPLRIPECLNLSGLDLGSACSPGAALDASRWSNLETEQCEQGGYMRHERGQAQCG